MNYSEINTNTYRKILPEIEKNSINIQWNDEWYDGPISGMLIYNNKQFRFEKIEEATENQEANEGWFRRLIILELDELQLKNEYYWHDRFLKEVDAFKIDITKLSKEELNDINNLNEAFTKKVQPYFDDFKKTYELFINNNKVIGWFWI